MGWPEVFETDRLILRPPVESDAAAIFDGYAQDPEVTRYLMWRPHQTVRDTQAYLQRCTAGWQSGVELTWTLTDRADKALLGAIAVRPDGHKANLGYVLARAAWGRGLMTEAGGALLHHAQRIERVHRVWAVCDVDNRASARVMQKIGMSREGVLRRWVVHPNISATPRDALCYSWIRA
jgi:ribosomal-protein-alanine N-acetyltransferase